MFFHFGFALLNVAGALASRALVVHLGADHRVRAHQHALAALNAEFLVPHRNHLGNIALLPLRRLPSGNVPPGGSALTGS